MVFETPPQDRNVRQNRRWRAVEMDEVDDYDKFVGKGLLGKLIARLLWLSVSGTLGIAFLVCVFPVRWDIKSFAPILPQFDSPGIAPNSRILFVSEDNHWENGHYAQFGLDLITFPKGRFDWIVFKEGEQPTSWPPRWTIDQGGNFYARGEDSAWQRVEGIPQDLAPTASTVLVVRSPEAKARVLERWASLGTDSIVVMKHNAASFWQIPRLRITLSQSLRIFVLVFILVAAFAFLSSLTGEDRRLRWLNLGLVIPTVLVLHTVVVYLLGRITSEAIAWAFAAEFLATLALIIQIYRKRVMSGPTYLSTRAPRPDSRNTAPARLMRPEFLLLAGVLIYLSVSIFRLDFDSDVFTQYLPVARYHYLAGSNQPEVLLDRYGLMTQATHPPGFSILISTLMWIGDLPRETPIQFGDQTNLVVFLYRFTLSILHLSFLAGVAGLFGVLLKKESRWGWLLPIGMIPLTVPLFLGRPDASEVYLVPLVGFSIVALFAGDELKRSIYTNLGLFFGGFGLFLKKEGLLILLLIILPWYVAGRVRSSTFSLRHIATNSLSLFLGLIPFLIWKMEINSLHLPEYFYYDRFSLAKLMSSLALIKGLVEKAIKILLGNSYWVALFLVLPLATIYDWLWRRRWSQSFIPLGIVAYVGGMTLVYLFSRSPGGPFLHMDVSYERILGVGIVSAILYSARAVFCGGEELSMT